MFPDSEQKEKEQERKSFMSPRLTALTTIKALSFIPIIAATLLTLVDAHTGAEEYLLLVVIPMTGMMNPVLQTSITNRGWKLFNKKCGKGNDP